jgi:hypothetical protein
VVIVTDLPLDNGFPHFVDQVQFRIAEGLARLSGLITQKMPKIKQYQ